MSADTIFQEIRDNKLYTTRLIRKAGRLPRFIKPFLGKVAESWVVEYSIVDPGQQTMNTWSSNLEHRGILKVEEHTIYKASAHSKFSTTLADYHVLFSSNFDRWGIKDRIESWSLSKFRENIMKSRRGMSFVMENLREKGIAAFRQMQLQTSNTLMTLEQSKN